MAITTTTARLALTTTLTTVYTVPASKRATVSLLQITPVDPAASPAVAVTAQWTDASASDAATYLCFEEPIEVGQTGPVYPLGGVLYLDAGDTIKAKASAAGDAELTFSAMIEDVS